MASVCSPWCEPHEVRELEFELPHADVWQEWIGSNPDGVPAAVDLDFSLPPYACAGQKRKCDEEDRREEKMFAADVRAPLDHPWLQPGFQGVHNRYPAPPRSGVPYPPLFGPFRPPTPAIPLEREADLEQQTIPLQATREGLQLVPSVPLPARAVMMGDRVQVHVQVTPQRVLDIEVQPEMLRDPPKPNTVVVEEVVEES